MLVGALSSRPCYRNKLAGSELAPYERCELALMGGSELADSELVPRGELALMGGSELVDSELVPRGELALMMAAVNSHHDLISREVVPSPLSELT